MKRLRVPVVVVISLCLTACGGGGASAPVAPSSGVNTFPSVPPTPAALAFTVASDNTLSAYSADVRFGRLRSIAYVPTGPAPAAVVSDAAGSLVYVAGSDGVTAYALDGLQWARRGTTPVTGGAVPIAAERDPVAPRLFVLSQDGLRVYATGANGAVSAIGGVTAASAAPRALGLDPAGKFAFVATDAGIDAFRIGSDGSLTAAGAPVATASTFDALASDTAGHLFAANAAGDVEVYNVASDGTLAPAAVPATPVSAPTDLELDPSDHFLYVADGGNRAIDAFNVAANGRLSPIAPTPLSARPTRLALSGDGAFVYALMPDSDEVATFLRNATSGGLTYQGATRVRAGTVALALGGDQAVVTAPYAYAANFDSKTVTAFVADVNRGTLQAQGTPVPTTDNPEQLTVHPNGRFVYVADFDDQSGATTSRVDVFAVQADGGLSAAGGAPVNLGPSATDARIDPSGRFLYVSYKTIGNTPTGTVIVFRIDPATGALTEASRITTGECPAAEAIDPTGRFLYTIDTATFQVSAFAIDTGDGALTPIGHYALASGLTPESVAIDPSGRNLYVAASAGGTNPGAVQGFTIDAATGALTPQATSSVAGVWPQSIAFDPSGRFAYVVNQVSADVDVYPVDRDGLLAPSAGRVSADNSPMQIDVDPSGRFVYVANRYSSDLSMYRINDDTGLLDPLGNIATPAPRALAFLARRQ